MNQNDISLAMFDLGLLRIPGNPHANLSRLEVLRKNYPHLLAQHSDKFAGLETYCGFIGYPRSGHSLLGAIIDAHPNAIVSHEFDTLQYVAKNSVHPALDSQTILTLILENSQLFARYGREWQGHQYLIPNELPGVSRHLKVIGDKKGDQTVFHYRSDPEVFARLQETLQLPIKLIHAFRNPYDNIARISTRDRVSIEAATTYYFSIASSILEMKEIADIEVIDIANENLISSIQSELSRLLTFLGLEVTKSFTDNVSKILFERPNTSRQLVDWTDTQKGVVAQKSKDYPWLESYEY